MTYKQLQKITLEKLFATQGAFDLADDVTKDYLRALPAAANEALCLLALGTEGKIKRLEFTAKEGETIHLRDIAADYLRAESGLISSQGRIASGAWQISGSEAIVSKAGEYALYYKASPELLTMDMAPEAQLDVSVQAAALLPLYIASQLYKDDDAEAAYAYRREFEAGREALNYACSEAQGEFVQTAGWCV